jgi:hypothetical protein
MTEPVEGKHKRDTENLKKLRNSVLYGNQKINIILTIIKFNITQKIIFEAYLRAQ